jgi:hypothetical protein
MLFDSSSTLKPKNQQRSAGGGASNSNKARTVTVEGDPTLGLSREELQVLLSDRALQQQQQKPRQMGPSGSASKNRESVSKTTIPTEGAQEDEDKDEDSNSMSVALNADEYLAASSSAASLFGGGGDNGGATTENGNNDELDGAGISYYYPDDMLWGKGEIVQDEIHDREGPYSWDPAYRTALEALMVDPDDPSDYNNADANTKRGPKWNNNHPGRSFTVQDLKIALETGSAPSSKSGPRSAAGGNTRDGTTEFGDELHAKVLEGEEGFLKQSQAFKESLTDPKAAQEVTAARRGAMFRQRNQQSIRNLEGQLAQLQHSIKEGRKQRRQKIGGKKTPLQCARCRCLLTPGDVDATRKQRRDVRLCPVCHAETMLVRRHEPRRHSQCRTTSLLLQRHPPSSSASTVPQGADNSSGTPPATDGNKAPP